MSELATVTAMADIADHAGERVRVVGTYTMIDLRATRTPPPVYRGHAALRLQDGTTVLLEAPWREEALRPSEESARLRDKQAAAVGVILPFAPSPPDGSNSLRAPCLSPIESISAQ